MQRSQAWRCGPKGGVAAAHTRAGSKPVQRPHNIESTRCSRQVGTGPSRSAAKWDGRRYKDTDVESKRWAKWVEKVPVGRVVVICITDTAMARTRPLGAHRIADTSAMHARARRRLPEYTECADLSPSAVGAC